MYLLNLFFLLAFNANITQPLSVLYLLVYKDFFKQGDLEKAMGNRPVEMMDRDKACIPALQIQFIDDVALPVYT